jgi:hypothetical protein
MLKPCMAALWLWLWACVLLSVEVEKGKVWLVLKGTGGVEFLVVVGTSLSVGFGLFDVSQ